MVIQANNVFECTLYDTVLLNIAVMYYMCNVKVEKK
jgi:hypothetical protein